MKKQKLVRNYKFTYVTPFVGPSERVVWKEPPENLKRVKFLYSKETASGTVFHLRFFVMEDGKLKGYKKVVKSNSKPLKRIRFKTFLQTKE